MQKLIFRNANGVEVDLTSGNFGITEWKGFSDVSLNLQTQQVPFQDGSVYLDGLLGNREISVTLAVNDNNDLEKRYELRRNLIEILNPKLGEGTLIYKNDYLMRQIKGVPLLPVFKNKNSNDRGTLKASLAWTCPSPYWEDVEETKVLANINTGAFIQNDGDVPVNVDLSLFGNIKNIKLYKGLKKQIELNGECDNLQIKTKIGGKKIESYEKKSFMPVIESDLKGAVVAEDKRCIIFNCHNGVLFTQDLKTFELYTDYLFDSILYDGTNFVGFKYSSNNFLVCKSSDAKVWEPVETTYPEESIDINSSCYNSSLGKYAIVGASGKIWTSQNLVSWESKSSGTANSLNVICQCKNEFVVGGNNGTVIVSSDGEVWEIKSTVVTGAVRNIMYISDYDKYYVLNETWCYMGESLESLEQTEAQGDIMTFIPSMKRIVISNGLMLYISDNGGEEWYRGEDINRPSTAGNYMKFLIYVGFLRTVLLNSSTLFYSYSGYEFYQLFLTISRQIRSVAESDDYLFIIDYQRNLYIKKKDEGSIVSKTLYPSNTVIKKFKYLDSLKALVLLSNTHVFVSYDNGESCVSYKIHDSGQYDSTELTDFDYSENQKRFIVCGNKGHVYDTTDFVNWERSGINEDVTLSGIICAKEYYKNVYDSKYYDYWFIYTLGKCFYSRTGFSWYEVTRDNSSQGFDKLAYLQMNKTLLGIRNNSVMQIGNFFAKTISKIPIESGTYTRFHDMDVWSNKNYFVCYYQKWLYISSDGRIWEKFLILEQTSPMGVEILKDVILRTYGSVYILEFSQLKNMISKLTEDSNLSIMADKGRNEFFIANDNKNVSAVLTYRQKYIGV